VGEAADQRRTHHQAPTTYATIAIACDAPGSDGNR
jgi:hypothetical protein